MSPEHEPTATIEDEALGLEGADRADDLIDQHVNKSGTIGDVRGGIQTILVEVKGDSDATARVEQYQSAFIEATTGHDNVQLRDYQGGLQGTNRVGTSDSTANDDLVEAEQLIENTEVAEEVLDHENDPEKGHRGQEAGRDGLVTADAEVVEGAELYEGEEESTQALDKRGSASAARAGQPAETYGSGQQKVAPHHRTFSDYLRNGTDRLSAQAELMRGQSREKIMMTLAESGQYSKEESLRITTMAV